MKRWETTALLLLALFLAGLGMGPLADHMTQRVLSQCHEIPWLTFFRPFKNPPPMDAWGVRPISVFILKIYEQLFGYLEAPPTWALFLRSAGILAAFGLAGRAWLRQHGYERYATGAAAASMTLAPTLFSAWYLPEFDTLGAAGILWVGTLLARPSRLDRLEQLSLIPATAVAFGLKESSALMQFAFLSAGLMTHLVRRERLQAERHLRMLVGGTLLWMLLAAPLMMMQNGNAAMANTYWFDRLPILEHNLDQYVYLLGAPGAALAGAWAASRLLPKYAWVPPFLLAGLLLASPIVVFYSHYEAIYYAPRYFPLGFGLVLAGAMAALWRENRAPSSKLARSFYYAMAIYGAALMASPSAREDLASRIFLAMAPLLHALALEGAEGLWRRFGEEEAARKALGRGATALLAVAWLWYPLASCFNFSMDWRARQAAEYDGRSQLAKQELQDSVVLFNHYVQLVGPYELRQFGVEDLRKSTQFLQVSAWPGNHRLPEANWGGRVVLEDLYQEGQLFYLYWFRARSTMDPRVNASLVGDLSWTRRDYGLFTPYDYQPGVAVAIPPEDIPVSNGAPSWNRMEETRISTYSSADPYLHALFAQRGHRLYGSERPFYQLPMQLTEMPLRLAAKIPLVESYVYEQQTWKMLNPHPRPAIQLPSGASPGSTPSPNGVPSSNGLPSGGLPSGAPPSSNGALPPPSSTKSLPSGALPAPPSSNGRPSGAQ